MKHTFLELGLRVVVMDQAWQACQIWLNLLEWERTYVSDLIGSSAAECF